MVVKRNYGETLVRTVGIVWAAPASAIGLLLCPFFRIRAVTRGILLCQGADWPRRLGWRYRAITFGHVVLSIDTLDEATLRHELAHTRQYEVWGPLLIPAYALAALWTRLKGGHYHRDNPFEVAANKRAGR